MKSVHALVTAVVLAVCGFSTIVSADLVSSAPVSLEQERATDLAKVQRFLEDKVVREKMKALGFDPSEIDRGLTRISDADLHRLAVKAEQIVAGSGPLDFLLTLALLILVIVVILAIV